MKPQKARGNQRQSEAIRCLSYMYRGQQRPSDAIRPHLRRNQTQSDAIRRNQAQSDAISMPGALCFRVFVFWAGRKGLCFVFLCFEPAQRACVLCFRVLADPPQNTARGQEQIAAHQFRVVAVGPQQPGNVGMIARACANFDCDDLALVAPEYSAAGPGRLTLFTHRPLCEHAQSL
jgi:hypothetical protein